MGRERGGGGDPFLPGLGTKIGGMRRQRSGVGVPRPLAPAGEADTREGAGCEEAEEAGASMETT